MTCQTCGAALPAGARFCPSCGTELPAGAAHGSRRPVTVVLTDVVGSTEIGERLDAETLGGLMTRYYEAMREVVEAHGGAVEKFIGDAVVAVFGAHQVHEDDALRAVRAAHAMHERLATMNDELAARWGTRLEVRTGVATGDVLAGSGAAVLGSPANLAARLQAAAADGEIVLAAGTERLVRGHVRAEAAGTLELKGFDEAVPCFRLIGLDGAGSARVRTGFVGRAAELALLELAYGRAVRDRRAQLATVLGEPGIGKTRLVTEAIARLEGDPLVLRGRCLPYGEGRTFAAIAEALAEAAGIEPADDAVAGRAKVAALVPAEAADAAAACCDALGIGREPASLDEARWAIRRFLDVLAGERPLVLAVDDLQWAEPAFLELVEQVVARGRGVPELVVAVSRPELHEQRPGWAGGAANAITISLEPLAGSEEIELLRLVAPAASFDDETAALLAAPAGGNPLFLEEYVAMLLDEGALTEHAGRWHVPADVASETHTPPTLLGLLTARLHRLPAEERETIVVASVIGKVFGRDELDALLAGDAADLDAALAALLEHGVLVAADAQALEFQHQLLRDAAYATLPKRRRAELHERFADHVERTTSSVGVGERDELIGSHLARALTLRAELAAPDERDLELAARAAVHLGAAGRHALARSDLRAAVRLLRQAATWAGDPAERAELELRLVQASADAGDRAGADLACSQGSADARAAGDERLVARFEQLEMTAAIVREPGSVQLGETEHRLRALASRLDRLDDPEGSAECHFQLATLAWIRGDASTLEGESRLAHGQAVPTGDARLIGRTASYVANALLLGPTPLDDAIDELRRIGDDLSLGRIAAANLRLHEAELLACVDRRSEAEELLDRSSGELDELGALQDLGAAESVRGLAAALADDLEAAADAYHRSSELFRSIGDTANGGLVSAALADVLARLGRLDEADEVVAATSGSAADLDIEVQVGWRVAAARIRAARGDRGEALRLIAEADARLETSDFVVLRADTMRATGEVLAAIGRLDDAHDRLEWARAAYAAKGHRAGERAAAARLAELEGAAAGS